MQRVKAPNATTMSEAMTGWMEHDEKTHRRMGMTVILLVTALTAPLYLLTYEIVYLVTGVTLAVAGSLLFLWSPKGWAGCWSMRVILPGDEVRSQIVRRLTEAGLATAIGHAGDAPRYFRKFEAPILVPGEARIWIRSEHWSQRMSFSETRKLYELTIIVIEPWTRGPKSSRLLNLVPEALGDAASRYYAAVFGDRHARTG